MSDGEGLERPCVVKYHIVDGNLAALSAEKETDNC